MAANNVINLVGLDFDNLKNSFINYLKSQQQFKDYDFAGSNMNVLLDVLSHNTFKNAFYLNMVASEAFLDSAQLKQSVISHAKELNYIPRSARSANPCAGSRDCALAGARVAMATAKAASRERMRERYWRDVTV